jgi:hypothetical protein
MQRSLYQYYVESRRELSDQVRARVSSGDRKSEETLGLSSSNNTEQIDGVSMRGSLRYIINRDSAMYRTLFPVAAMDVDTSTLDKIEELQDEIHLTRPNRRERTESINVKPEESFFASWQNLLQNYWRLAIAPISRVQIAGILIQHAKNGVPPILLYTQAGYFAYTLRYKLTRVLRLCAWLLMFFPLLALPPWTSDVSNAGDNSIYPTTIQSPLPKRAVYYFCLVLLSLLAVALLMEGVYRWHETVIKHASDLDDYIKITEDRALDVDEKFRIITDPRVTGVSVIEREASHPKFSKLLGSGKFNISEIIEYLSPSHFTKLALFFMMLLLNISLLIVSISSDNFISPLLVPFSPFLVLWFDRHSRRRFKLIGNIILK